MTIFLDIDGVLNRQSQWKTLYTINEECVKEFANLCNKLPNKPDIVLTSSWRHGFTSTLNPQNASYIKNLENMLKKYGITISDKTPDLRGRTRDKEIQRYLYFHQQVTKYIIIDDDKNEYAEINKHNYFVDAAYGFSQKDIKGVMKCI